MLLRLIPGLAAAALFGLGSMVQAAGAPTDAKTLPAAAVEVGRTDGSALRLSVRAPDIGHLPTAVTGATADRLALDLEPATARPGWPELPMVSRLVLIPPEAGVRIVIRQITSRVESGFTPFIVPPQDGRANLDASGSPDPEFLQCDGFWPPDPVVVGEPAILRGHRLVSVTVFPVQVNPATGEVRYNDDVDFDLVFEGRGANPIVDPSRLRPSSTIHRVIRSLVVNPPPPSRDGGLPERGSYLLVYLNANGIANSLAPLIAWRQRQGWEVRTLAAQVNASPDAIKRDIQTAYNDWDLPPEMIALVGDPDWGSNGIPAWGNYTDLDYARLDGNDILADADYGRITARSLQELDRVVAKVVNYESDPWMQDTDWYRQGAVCAGASISGLSTILVSKWVRRETMDRGWNSVDEWYYNAGQGDVPTFFANQFRRGISYATYRGWVGMEGLSADAIMGFQAHRRYPFATPMTCSSGQYVQAFSQSEGFFISAGGAIGAIGLATNNTHVQYNNAVFSGIWHGLLKFEMFNIGTACNYGRFELYRQYAGFQDGDVTNFSQWANLMGDPATEMFTAIPQLITAEHDRTLPLGGSRVIVAVTERGGETPIPGASVCLFKSADDYQMVLLTDDAGIANFAVLPDALTNGNLLVTITKHNVKPYLGQITVGQAEEFLGTESWEITNDDDGDGIANPGEAFDLNIILKNFGSRRPEGQMSVSAESLSPWARVTGAEVQLEQAPDPGEAADVAFAVQIDPAAPHRTAIPIAINSLVGNTVWRSMAAIEVVAPDITLTDAFLPNNRFNPGDVAEVDFAIANTGEKRLAPSTATLLSESNVVTVIGPQANYPAIEPGRSARIAGARFRIRAHPLAVPGIKVTLRIAMETEAGFRDTTSYLLTIGQPAVTDPFGPDKYGYVCFDSGDRNWEMAPTYDWVEIDPNVQGRDFNGTFLNNLTDGGEDNDKSQAVDLPFAFQYYGVVNNRLTICTNGWAAFGNWTELSDFRNRRINSGEGPNSQLCVFWDDLTTGRICTFYDRDRGRFIVEWNGMRSLADGSAETFELILYDTRLHPTYSGDGIILFQYQDVRNVGGVGPSADTPYATIGIGSPNDTDGLEYTYYNTYARGAKPLEDTLAIKFTTAVQYITGVLAVRVSDAATGAPVEDAEVTTTRGFWGETDSLGLSFISDILIGDYASLTVRKQGYNDSTWTGDQGDGFSIFEAETLWVDIALLHPEFNIDVGEFQFQMLADSTVQTGIILSNDGNGTLTFTSRFTYVVEQENEPSPRAVERGPLRRVGRDDPDEPWDRLIGWNAAAPTGNNRLQAIAFVRDHWVVSGGHIGNEGDNYFYEFTRNGEYTGNRFLQPVGGSFGLRDMEYYDGFLYCTYSDSSYILRVDPATGEELARWRTPRNVNNCRNLTIDPATGHIWTSGLTTRLYEFELVGDTALVEIRTFRTIDPRTNSEIHEYGIAWFRDDPDGFNIYLISNDEAVEDPDNQRPNISIYKMSPTTGETRFLTDLAFMDPAMAGRGGMTITPKWNNLVWALATVFDTPTGDEVGVFELAPNSSWIDYQPRTDTLTAMEQQPIDITITTADLDTGRYGVVIEFIHNATGGVTRVPVRLDLVLELPDVSLPDDQSLPTDYALEPNWPNPFNAVTSIGYSLREPGAARLELFDIQGRLVQTLLDERRPAGKQRLALNANGLPAGLYIYRLKTGDFTASRKMLLVK